jgi:hypothetical protein
MAGHVYHRAIKAGCILTTMTPIIWIRIISIVACFAKFIIYATIAAIRTAGSPSYTAAASRSTLIITTGC